MSVDKANPPNVKGEVTTSQNNNLVTAKTLEMMTEDEVEEIMEQRQRKNERPEWGKNPFGEDRPLSAWDYI
jgi:hypothetical protein